MRIVATMPTHKVMEIPAVMALLKMQKDFHDDGHEFDLLSYSGFNPYFSRNLLFKGAMKKDVDWILSLDSDHVYSARAFYDLAERKVDIICAKYYVSGGVGLDQRPLAMGNWKDGEHKKFLQIYAPKNERGLHECDVIGFGFTLIRPEVMVKIYKDGDSFFTPSGSVFQTDDVLFCNKAKDCGYKIYYDADVLIGHLAVTSNI